MTLDYAELTQLRTKVVLNTDLVRLIALERLEAEIMCDNKWKEAMRISLARKS